MCSRIVRKRGLIFVLHLATFVFFNTCKSPGLEDRTLLELVSKEHSGVNFKNEIVDDIHTNVFSYTNLFNGGGVAIGDINNDGLEDIFFTANHNSGKLYLNKGELKFEDITKGSGLDTLPGWKTGVTMADVNQDGFIDIYVCRSGRERPKHRANFLFINNGDLTFTEKAKEFGLDSWNTSTQAAFFDYDLDGDLDMYLLNHNTDPVRKIFRNFNDNDINQRAGDKLFENVNGKYVEVKEFIGIKRSKLGDGLGIAVVDLNNDLYPDIYICNDFAGRDYLYFNNGDGTFRESAHVAMKHMTISSMGVDMADIDNDGWLDLFVLDMVSSTNYGRKTNMSGMEAEVFDILVNLGGHYQYMTNTLQLNNGNGTFSDIAPLAGVTFTNWSWGPLLADLDNDGLKDIFVANGMQENTNNIDFDNFKEQLIQRESNKPNPEVAAVISEMLRNIPEEKVVNQVYKNMDGLKFKRMNKAWGVHLPTFSNGAAYADLDNDGDLDLVVNNINDYAHIYRNNATDLTGNHFLKVKLQGEKPNVHGVGARVMVQTGDVKQYLEQQVTRGYQSASTRILHFGLGKSELIDLVQVKWPDGKVSEMKRIAADQLITVDHAGAIVPKGKKKIHKPLLFADMTDAYKIDYKHVENDYDDYKREVLLPYKLSALGPALTVGDVNGDGLDDFFAGGAMGFPGVLYLQQSNGVFSGTKQRALIADKDFEDLDATFFDAEGDGDLDLYVVSGSTEHRANSRFYQDRLYLNDGSGKFTKSPEALPEFFTSGGVVRVNDFDSDGDPDLFVGGRIVPGRYPEPADSYILENDRGIFSDVTNNVAPDLKNLGLVTDAVWSDFNGDGIRDLIVVGEWMPVTLMQNTGGKLQKVKGNSVIENSEGWWFSITEADLDQDGDQDYILGNLGENYTYKARPDAPFRAFINDFDNNGHLDIVLGYYEDSTLYPLRGKDCTLKQIPGLKNRYKDYHSFGLASLEDIYGADALASAYQLKATTFSNSLLLNTDSGFAMKSLPSIAQISAVFGSVYDDFDGDGIKDIVMAGNLYHSEIKTVRNDAGQGLYLKGRGGAVFVPVRGYNSGLFIPGDVKKVKAIRLGLEARKGIIAGINNDYLKLISVQLPR